MKAFIIIGLWILFSPISQLGQQWRNGQDFLLVLHQLLELANQSLLQMRLPVLTVAWVFANNQVKSLNIYTTPAALMMALILSSVKITSLSSRMKAEKMQASSETEAMGLAAENGSGCQMKCEGLNPQHGLGFLRRLSTLVASKERSILVMGIEPRGT
ncbi:hypothetical protein H1C71_007273 [Ictidomys tridecemlineatus]|nr:hypothetical protein H1C71_007273 [Ictidomys tridecemlineatus]KAG3280293.1 hypothetical protein H1C71_007273 [Ictidomys tridecemlineatus]KAG3280294.1 hypothetical protein H1C71_007273 [Ictidomys tridecemlineatus]